MNQRVWLLPLIFYFYWQFLTVDLAFDKDVFSDRWLDKVRFQITLMKLVLDMCMQFSFKIKGEAKSGCSESAGMPHRWGTESRRGSGLPGHWESRAGLVAEIRIS